MKTRTPRIPSYLATSSNYIVFHCLDSETTSGRNYSTVYLVRFRERPWFGLK